MVDKTEIPTKLTWGAPGSADYVEVDFTSVPERSLAFLCISGFRHKLGNEVAAATTAWKKSDDGKAASEDDVKVWSSNRRKEMLDKILSDELGIRATAAPRVTGIDAYMRAAAVEWLKGKNIKLPTGDKTVALKAKDGTETQVTRDQLIERTIARKGDELRPVAEAKMAADAALKSGSHAVSGAVEDLFGDE